MVRGHNRCEDELARFLKACGSDVCQEQLVPAWNRPVYRAGVFDGDGRPVAVLDRDGEPVVELAVLDNGYHDRKGRRCWADVTYTAATTTCAEELPRRAQTDGRGAAEAERDKLARYRPERNPAEGFTPFAFEGRGRPGDKAVGLVRAMAPAGGTGAAGAVRGALIGRAWQGFSVCCQRRLAELLLSAEGAGAPGVRRQHG